MGFIDWLTKDNNVEISEVKENKEFEANQFEDNFEEDLNSLRELSNSEKMETAEYNEETSFDDDFKFESQISSFASSCSIHRNSF